MAQELKEGQIYNSSTHGLVRYEGLDNFMGEITFKFFSITYKSFQYWRPETLYDHLIHTEIKL